MKPQNKITVPKKSDGQRLDVFLAKKLKISRSRAQKMIVAEQVLVNKKLPKKAGDNLTVGGVIVIARSRIPRVLSGQAPQSQQPKGLPRSLQSLAMTVKIIAVTPDYVVVDKPTGMLTHPTMAGEKNTLVDFLIKKYPEILKVGDRNENPLLYPPPHKGRISTDPLPYKGRGKGWGFTFRPGIVHRLDKEASGLMVIARTQKMFNHLKEQFKNRTIEKEYIALAHEPMARDWDEIHFPISRSETSDRMAAIPVGEASRGKEAKTEFSVEKNFINFSLLRVKTHTGRMHQIRVHMLAFNHPLVGDPLYFQKKQKRTWDEKLGRLFLHSTKLGFTDLEGKMQTFESPLPKELTEFLKLLK